MSHTFRGYGPNLPLFTGEADDFELWSVKFGGMIRLQNLIGILDGTETMDSSKNAQIFAHLVNCLDDKSLNLIIRDAPDKGKEAFQILKDHYLGATKPRIIALYTELTTLKIVKMQQLFMNL